MENGCLAGARGSPILEPTDTEGVRTWKSCCWRRRRIAIRTWDGGSPSRTPGSSTSTPPTPTAPERWDPDEALSVALEVGAGLAEQLRRRAARSRRRGDQRRRLGDRGRDRVVQRRPQPSVRVRRGGRRVSLRPSLVASSGGVCMRVERERTCCLPLATPGGSAMEPETDTRTAVGHAVHGMTKETAALIESLPIGIVIADQDGRVVEKNSEADRIWGGPLPMAGGVSEYGAYQGWWADTGEKVKPEEWALARAVDERRGLGVGGRGHPALRRDARHDPELGGADPRRVGSGRGRPRRLPGRDGTAGAGEVVQALAEDRGRRGLRTGRRGRSRSRARADVPRDRRRFRRDLHPPRGPVGRAADVWAAEGADRTRLHGCGDLVRAGGSADEPARRHPRRVQGRPRQP